MPETRPRWTGIAVSIALVAFAIGLVVAGAAFGPTHNYLLPSEAFARDIGREVVVGGTVVDIIAPSGRGRPVYVLADDMSTRRRRVRVEYIGPSRVSFSPGSTAIFVGTVKRTGVIKARECVNHAAVTPLATATAKSASR